MRARSISSTRRPAAILRDSTDAQLLELAASGSAEAFDAIVDRHRPGLLRYCGSQTRAERVDDAVQQTFVNAWLALGRGVQVRELRPWLYSIARNASIDQLRLHRGEQVEISHELAGGTDPAAIAADRDEMNHVLRAVAELPERQRTALLETAVHGKSTQLVADEMGMSGGALRQLVHRARTSVRGMVASVFPAPVASWFAQATGDEGTRRVAMLFGAAGQSATSAALAATATVASVGAIGTAGIASLAEPPSRHGEAVVATPAVRRPAPAAPSSAQTLASTNRGLVQVPLRSAAANAAAGAGAKRGAPRGAAADTEAGAGARRDRDARRSGEGDGSRTDGAGNAETGRSRRGAGAADRGQTRRRQDDRDAGRGRSADGRGGRRPEAAAASGDRRRGGRRGSGDGTRPARSRNDAPVTPAPSPAAQPDSPTPSEPATTVTASDPEPAPSPTDTVVDAAADGAPDS